jgi:hypothetical protein
MPRAVGSFRTRDLQGKTLTAFTDCIIGSSPPEQAPSSSEDYWFGKRTRNTGPAGAYSYVATATMTRECLRIVRRRNLPVPAVPVAVFAKFPLGERHRYRHDSPASGPRLLRRPHGTVTKLIGCLFRRRTRVFLREPTLRSWFISTNALSNMNESSEASSRSKQSSLGVVRRDGGDSERGSLTESGRCDLRDRTPTQ